MDSKSAGSLSSPPVRDPVAQSPVVSSVDSSTGSAAEASKPHDQPTAGKKRKSTSLKCGMPSEIAEAKRFKALQKVLDPGFEVRSRMTIYRDVLSLYLSEKQKLKDYITENCQRVCLTVDTWTSTKNLNYMCLTAHFIDRNWKLHKKILNFCLIGSHEGLNIGKTLETCLLEWGIEKVFTVTLNNTTANDIALKYLTDCVNSWNTAIMKAEFMQVRCATHALSLVVKDGLKVYRQSITRIRAVVKYVLSSPSRLGIFKQCAEREKINSKKDLCLDVKTRWDSTCVMLEAAEKFEKAFKRLEMEDTKFYIKFCSSTSTVDKEASILDIEKGSCSDSGSDEETSAPGKKARISGKGKSPLRAPNAEDWSYARNLVEFLKAFLEATVTFSASTSDTSDSFLCEDIHGLRKGVNSEDPFLNHVANTMSNKYTKYWGSHEDTNPFLFIAVLLDPRLKEVGLKFYLDELCEENEELAVKLMGKVKSVLEKLFEQYKLLYPVIEDVVAEPSSLREAYKRRRKLREERINAEYKSELDRYLKETCDRYCDNSFNLLDWWKRYSATYRILSYIARDILAIPMSSATESVFSTEKRILDPFQSLLPPRTIEALICTRNWLRSTTDLGLSGIVDDVDDIETDILGPVTNFTCDEE